MLNRAAFRNASLRYDLVAGIALAAIALPEQIATARLAGMPSEAGLYAFAAGSLMYAIFGADRFASVGADSTIATIFAAAIVSMTVRGSAEYVTTVGLLSLASGVLLVIAGALRAGWIADLLSVPVTVGFLTGIAVHVIVGQVPLILGVDASTGSLVGEIVQLSSAVSHANTADVTLGIAVIVLSVALGRVSAKLPAPFIALAVAATAVSRFHLAQRGVATLGPLAFGMPHVSLFVARQTKEWLAVMPVALIVALVCMVQTAAVLRTFGADPSSSADRSRDFAAVGIGSIVAAGLGAFAVNASPPRTAAVRASGGRSQLTGVVAVACVAMLALFGARLTADVPQAGLGAILVVIGLRIVRGREIVRIARQGGNEIYLVAGSALLVIVFSIQTGMFLSIILSLLYGLYTIARPPSCTLVRVPGTTIWWPQIPGEPGQEIPGMLVFSPGAPITFTNARYIVNRLEDFIAAAPAAVKLVVIECSGVLDIDYTGALVVNAAFARLRRQHIDLALARLDTERAYRAAVRTGVIAAVGSACVFKTVYDAVRARGFGESAGKTR